MTFYVNMIGKKGVILALLDISPAIDTIDHEQLFELLQKQFGIKGTALNWIKSNFENLSSSIHNNSKTFSPTVTSFGIPRNSVLNPRNICYIHNSTNRHHKTS